jgi:beta-lactamase class C
MKHYFLFLLLFLSFAKGYCKEPPLPEFEEILTTKIKEFMKNKGVPGVTIALFYEGKGTLYSFGFADPKLKIKANPDTIFEIASLTKVFTSTALAVEVLRGKMALNDPVLKYLPSIQNNSKGISQVTLSQLATHTSSLPRVPPQKKGIRKYTPDLLMEYLRNWQPLYPIGSKSVYSNLGFGILGQAVANVEHESYAEAIYSLITGPLEMNSTMIHVPEDLRKNYAVGINKFDKPAEKYALNAWPGGGALRSTSRDMLKFLIANMDEGGPKELRKAMQLAQQGVYKVNNRLTMGLGWQRYAQHNYFFIDKNGGVDGFSSYIGIVPSRKVGIVILTNKGKTQITYLGRHLLARLGGLAIDDNDGEDAENN